MLLSFLPTGKSTCIEADEICCLCNDDWLCGVTACPLTTQTSTTTIVFTIPNTETTHVTTSLLTTTTVDSSTSDHTTDGFTTTVISTTRRTIITQTTTSVWEIVGYVFTGTTGLGAALYGIHLLFWYVLRICERRSRRDYDSYSSGDDLVTIFSLPMSRNPNFNVSESTV